MSKDQRLALSTMEVAQLLSVTSDKIGYWCQYFSEWFSFRSQHIPFSDDDVYIFQLIKEASEEIGDNLPARDKIYRVKSILKSNEQANKTKIKCEQEKYRLGILQEPHYLPVLLELLWLEPLKSQVDKVANIGCWPQGGICPEALSLDYVLEPKEITIIDKREEFTGYQEQSPKNKIKLTQADITNLGDKIPRDYFDLVFCKDTLYIINDEQGVEGVELALREIAGLVKTGGWVIGIENWIEIPISTEYLVGIGLQKTEITGADERAACYRKVDVVRVPSTSKTP